ncbi:MAG: hypothetical protein KDC48_16515 [Planctomycetes bacterium]|nr:hypothetical protein [Planctomycetota bacterium]
MSRSVPVLPFALLAASLCAPSTAQELKGRVWTHEKFGIKMTIPDGFSVVPLQIDEQWIAAKFLSEKTYLSKDKEWNHEHKPLLRVIVFTEKAKQGTGVEKHEKDDGSTFIGIGAVPYQGYRDYVKRHRSGFFFSKEEEDKVGGEDCLMCEVDVHKGEPKLHLYSVVFRRPTYEVAVEMEVLEDRRDQLEKIALKVIDSLRFKEGVAETTAAVTGAGKSTSTRLWSAFREEWRKRPSLERAEIRKQMEADHHKAVRAKTPSDWTIEESKHFLVVSHADERFTKRMVDGAETFYSWCEKEFGKLGDDYVRRPVLRLCKDFDEYKAFHFDSSNTTGWSLAGADTEIGTYWDDYNGSSGRDVSIMFDDILLHYLQEMDTHIVAYTPYWLSFALDDYVGSAFIKGRKVEFKVDDYVRDESRNMQREGKLPDLRKVLEMDADAFLAQMKVDSRSDYAATQALRYVLGPGQREKPFKEFLQRYFKAVVAVADKHAGDWKSMDTRSAQTEEEEEQQAKDYSSRTKERRKQLQKEINEMVLNEIDEKAWEKYEKAFQAFVRAGK